MQSDYLAAQARNAFDLGRPIRVARAAWQRGDFAGCLAALDGLPIPSAGPDRAEFVFLRARAMLRVERPEDALELLEATADTLDGADAEATSLMLLGAAHARVHDSKCGLALLDEAAAAAHRGSAHPAIAAEIDYYRALTMRPHNLDLAESYARKAMQACAGVVSARAAALLGWLAKDRLQYRAAYDAFTLAKWMLIEASSGLDVHLATGVELELVIAELEIRDATFVGGHASRFEADRFPQFLRENAAPLQRFLMLRYDAWAFALDGDATRAVSRIWDAERFAREASPAWVVYAYAERAGITRAIGEVVSADQFARHALELSKAIDWAATKNAERYALRSVAEQIVGVDPEAAIGVFEKYRAIAGGLDSLIVPSLREKAEDEYVEGLIVRARGENRRAAELFRSAYRAFHELGLLWSSVLTLIELDRTPYSPGSHEAWALETAALITQKHFPHSFLVPMLGPWARIFEDDIGETLPNYLRETLRGLVRGESPKEIALRTDRAYSTIRGYVDELRDRFQVKSTRALIAEVVRRKIA